MTRYVFVDIDGCITPGKNRPFNLTAMDALREEMAKSVYRPVLCTGRSASYVEAIAQMLGLTGWAICENGGYLYHVREDRVIYHPRLGSATLSLIDRIKRQLQTDGKWTRRAQIEVDKAVALTLIANDGDAHALALDLREWLYDSEINVIIRDQCVDILPQAISKSAGVAHWARRHENPDLSVCCAIGDSDGDLGVFRMVGRAFAPANASESVRAVCRYVSEQAHTVGVIDIFRKYLSKPLLQ